MDKNIFLRRRERLVRKIKENNGIAIFASRPDKDVHHTYQQDEDFYYLTGFKEAKALAVLFADEKGETYFHLFNQPESPEAEIWSGALAGQKGACETYGAHDSDSIHELEEKLMGFLASKQYIYYPMARYPDLDEMILECMQKAKSRQKVESDWPVGLINSDGLVHDLRLHKDEYEIECMEKAAQISVEAHLELMKMCKPGLYEYELKAQLLSTFFSNDADGEAYPSIVGGGKNACVLHYIENQSILNDGDLVLVDAGASYRHYASDVTRTFPVNGCFTEAQAAIYNLVLKAQLSVIKLIKPGVPFSLLQETAIKVLTEGLIDLGILKGSLEEAVKTKAYSKYFMHGVSHWLGLDVHDVGSYGKGGSRELQAGMVLTVEPGLYFPASACKDIDQKWKHIGVRIEDDVLVTQNGSRVLSSGLPKTIEEIERCMAGE